MTSGLPSQAWPPGSRSRPRVPSSSTQCPAPSTQRPGPWGTRPAVRRLWTQVLGHSPTPWGACLATGCRLFFLPTRDAGQESFWVFPRFHAVLPPFAFISLHLRSASLSSLRSPSLLTSTLACTARSRGAGSPGLRPLPHSAWARPRNPGSARGLPVKGLASSRGRRVPMGPAPRPGGFAPRPLRFSGDMLGSSGFRTEGECLERG